MSRRLGFKIAAVLLALAVPLTAAGLYGLYRVLTTSIRYCGSYGQLDDELGWQLRRNATSCIALRDRIRGKVFFDSTVYTNDDGFRAPEPRGKSAAGAIAAIGDSWTFGYAINHEQAFPSQIAERLRVPVVNMGIPAYGSAATYLLFRRHVAALDPAIVVQLNLGFWRRSLCDRDTPQSTLIPCYQSNTRMQSVQLTVPEAGAVARARERGEYPGGALTTGYDSYLKYFLFSRIPEGFRAWRRGPRPDPSTDVELTNLVLTHELRQYAQLSATFGFLFVLIDPTGSYGPAVRATAEDWHDRMIYAGPEWWPLVADKMNALPFEVTHVPHDGHYSETGSRIVAEGIVHLLTGDARSAAAIAAIRGAH